MDSKASNFAASLFNTFTRWVGKITAVSYTSNPQFWGASGERNRVSQKVKGLGLQAKTH